MIIVDTSIWSLSFRRSAPKLTHPAVIRLRELIEQDADLRIPGVVLQEVLSGLRHEVQFHRLRRVLEAFPVELATKSMHTSAAVLFNTARSKGIAATPIDCLIAATAIDLGGQVLATDGDYREIAGFAPLVLLEIAG